MTAEAGLRDEIVSSAARWLAEAYGEERRRQTLAGEAFDATAWRDMAGLGWFGLAVPEARGGLGLGLGDLAALAERIGAANLPEPVAAVAGVAAPLLAASAGIRAADRLDGLVAGDRIVVLAHAEAATGYARHGIEARLTGEGGTTVLRGRKVAVEAGPHADGFIVTARQGDELAFVLVDRGAAGLDVTGYRAIDGRLLADVSFADVAIAAEARLDLPDPAAALDDALDRGALLAMADAVGAMEVVHGDTLAHLQTRRQFGRAIGAFQALQHRAVDMAIALEEARAVVAFAADCGEADRAERRRAVATAKVVGIRAARRIGREAVQMHGGMGITEELRVSHLFRRLVAAEGLYGDDDYYLDRFRADAKG